MERADEIRAVRLAAAAHAAVIAHARTDAPLECCGLLAGEGTRIDEAIPVRNVHPEPAVRYLIDPAAHVAANRRLRGTGRAIVGCYHSHPHTRAVPSATDLAEAYYPEFVWLIVSLADPVRPEVTAWKLAGGRFVPLPLDVVP